MDRRLYSDVKDKKWEFQLNKTYLPCHPQYTISPCLIKCFKLNRGRKLGDFRSGKVPEKGNICWLPGWFLAREKDKILYLGDLKAEGGILCFLPDYSWKLQDFTVKVSCILMMKNNAVNVYIVELLSRVWLFETPWVAIYQAPLPMDFPGKNTGVGCHSLLQGIFPNQGLNPSLQDWQGSSLIGYCLYRYMGQRGTSEILTEPPSHRA